LMWYCYTYTNRLMVTVGLSHLEQAIYFASIRQGDRVIDTDAASRLVDVSRPHAVKLLSTMARKGALHRVGRGQYVIVPPDVLYARKSFVADPYQVIDAIMRQDEVGAYYVAYQSAAFVYGAARQLPQELLVAVPLQRRPIPLGSSRIVFVQLRAERLFGGQEMRYHDSFFQVSDHEKTILDCLDRVDLSGGLDEVACTVAQLMPEADPDRLLSYCERVASKPLVQRLGFILERLMERQAVPRKLIDGLAQQVGKTVYLLDGHGSGTGPVQPRWRIRENATVTWEA
jgi:predicted transcriptional regulator of viral defense system